MQQDISIEKSIIEAYINGYKQRVKDQLKGALEGNPVGSHFNEDELNVTAKNYVTEQLKQQ